MPDTLELRAGPHRATVKVGDVVPMTDSELWSVTAIERTNERSERRTVEVMSRFGERWWHEQNGQCCGLPLRPRIDIAALAAQPPAVTLTVEQSRDIREAWNAVDLGVTMHQMSDEILRRLGQSLAAVPGLLTEARDG